ncbi:MAG: amino acid ABC transporter ATP-binding protein [Desulfohalobiaceae bacterium]|nr:amino acid ABC transporter ATP-binding protein [Desulfohalobiaceae bacterium]
MNSTHPLLLVQDLEKSYKGTGKVLDGITFSLNPREVKVIIGSSGGGKSTLLQCINLLSPYDRGKVFLDGVLVTEKNKNVCRQEIGYVFQHFNLFAHLTALDNVTLGPTTAKGVPPGEAGKTARELLEKVGLGDKMFNYPAELSGGQKQRLGIARALGMKPKLILFDEPTSALDPELIGEVLTIMKDLAMEGMTMLIVTHEMSFAQAVATEILFIEKGRIVEQGPPRQFSNPVHERTRQFLHMIEDQ